MATGEPRSQPGRGRAAALAQIETRYRDAQRDGSLGLIVCGEAGIGKTTLVEQFLESGAPALDGAVVARARCRLDDPHPFRPLAAILRDLGSDPTLVDRLIEDDDGGSAPDSDRAARRRYRAFAAVLAALRQAIVGRSTVVVVEDLHGAHQPLLGFLPFLADELAAERARHRLLVVLTTRIPPPPHPVSATIDELTASRQMARLDLGALDAATVDSITRSLQPDASPAYADLVARSARGNPLRAMATIRILERRGIDPTTSGADERTWGELRVPAPFDDPVTQWIAELERSTREVLGRVAVLGAEFDLDHAAAVTGDAADLRAALGAGLELQLLESDGYLWWFAHDLFRDALYDSIDLDTRTRAHQLAARYLAAAGAGDAATAVREIGHHYLAAAAITDAAELVDPLRQAGRRALADTAWTQAQRFLGAALRAFRRAPTAAPADQADQADHADLLYELGRAHYFDHDVETAQRYLTEAALAGRDAGLASVWGASLFMLSRLTTASTERSLRRVDDQRLVREFLDANDDPRWRSMLLQVRSEAASMAGRLDDALALAEEAMTWAERSGSDEARSLAAYARGFGHMSGLQMWDGLADVRRAAVLAERSGDWFLREVTAARLAFPLLSTGQLAEADEMAAATVRSAKDSHEHSNQALGLCVQAASALVRGELDRVDELCDDAEAATRRSSYMLADSFAGPTRIVAEIYRSNYEQARTLTRSWPNLSRSARRSLESLIDAFERPAPNGSGPPPRPRILTQMSASFHAAEIEAAVRRGAEPSSLHEAAHLLDQWREAGMEVPPCYPTSLTRLRAEVAEAQGEIDLAGAHFDDACRILDQAGAALEAARARAGRARLAAIHAGAGRAARADARDALEVFDELGLDPALLRLPVELRAAATELDPSSSRPWRAVLVTDVVGSTEVSRRLGDVAYLGLVLRHHELVRAALADWGGSEFSESGDGLLAWFESASAAFHAAVAIQDRVARHRNEGLDLQLRVSCSGGRPLFHQGRPYGLVLNRAARILAIAQPGEIVCDREVADALAGEVRTIDIRTAELKGLGTESVQVIDRI